MIAPEVLDALLAHGATAEMIVAAVKADNAIAEKAADERRAKDAQRQRRHRASRDVTVTNGDSADALSPVSPLNGFPEPLPNNPPLSPIPEPPIANAMDPIPDEQIREEDVIEAWNVMAGENGLPKARMTPERRKKLKTFIHRHSVDDITEAIWAIPRSSFLRGENDRGWRPGIDFLLQPSSFTKVIERTYEHG